MKIPYILKMLVCCVDFSDERNMFACAPKTEYRLVDVIATLLYARSMNYAGGILVDTKEHIEIVSNRKWNIVKMTIAEKRVDNWDKESIYYYGGKSFF